ncbi:F-box/kelch-repeat protein At3g23880-like [Syzygium oleosum]|uniref:F-box/kelch-repeat protein At3g23880-like n=1 Tax=Syzygium oleosum TaxID=219896 RepID=UPI0011D1F2CE|nr:F-box/kelch-repeat protein At3g23880-like [Syzygium oleosum]
MRSSSSDDDDEDPKLPHDVAVEILKRLPVECLLRFRCVCRSWRSAIDDPRLVALHWSHSALDASNWYLVCLDWCDRLCSLFSSESLTLPYRSRIEMPFATPSGCYDFVGSCNGLICVAEVSGYGYCKAMYLWNSFTRKHRAVPRSGLRHQFSSMEAGHEYLGFGFDAGSNDYKIVRILYSEDDNRQCFGGPKPRVEIYSVSTDSWRSSECEVPVFCDNGPAVFLNGNLHWIAFKCDVAWDERGYGSIVLFDVAGEVFDEMALPEVHVDKGSLMVSVAVLHDSLAVFINLVDAILCPGRHSTCSIWVMGEYGVPETWTKLYTFEACGLVTKFDGFTRNGELLMEIDAGERVSWNPITGQYANLPLSIHCDLVNVVESLVSL